MAQNDIKEAANNNVDDSESIASDESEEMIGMSFESNTNNKFVLNLFICKTFVNRSRRRRV